MTEDRKSNSVSSDSEASAGQASKTRGTSFHAALACGERGWCFDFDTGGAVLQTVGQIRIEFTQSEGNPDSIFSNYKPHPAKLVEQYMCVETGIGSGALYTLGESIFLKREECLEKYSEFIAKREREAKEWKERQRLDLIAEESHLRRKLARIEAAKTEVA